MTQPVTATEKLLNHFDSICGSVPRFIRVSDEGSQPAMFVAIYQGFPEPDTLTGFTWGLSHFHPPGGAHKELTISMRDTGDAWAFACGYLALNLRDYCPFVCGDTIDFRKPVAKSSSMSAFVVAHPFHISAPDTVIDLGVRRVEIIQLVPVYDQERKWLNSGGELKKMLQQCSSKLSMDPRRQPFALS